MTQAIPLSLRALPEADWNLEKAGHLLNRAGFGGTRSQAHQLRVMGRAAAVDLLLSGSYPGKPKDFEAPSLLTPDPIKLPVESGSQMKPEDPRAARRREAVKRDARLLSIQMPWLRAMHGPAAPLEKLTLFWHGMLTSGFSKVDNRPLMLAQNARLRSLALGDYRVLVSEMCVDPAMIRYLDIDQNSRRQPNENFARELLELFTLGESNYSDADIKSLAKVFVNLEIDLPPDDKELAPEALPSIRSKAGFQDRMRLIMREIGAIFRKPVCGELLCRRLLRFYLCDEPESSLVRDLSRVLRAAKWQLGPTLKVLFNSQRFYDRRDLGLQIKSPVQFLIMATRDLGLPEVPEQAAAFAMRELGQSLFNPPNVAGWSGGRSWINSSTLAKRYELVGQLIRLALQNPEASINEQLLTLPHLPETAISGLLEQWFPHLPPLGKRRLLENTRSTLKQDPHRLLLTLARSPEYQLC